MNNEDMAGNKYVEARLAIAENNVRFEEGYASSLEEKVEYLEARLAMAVEICQQEGDEWDSDNLITEKNYAHACRDRISALSPAGGDSGGHKK